MAHAFRHKTEISFSLLLFFPRKRQTKYQSKNVSLNTSLTHNLNSANGTSVTLYVPAPHSHGVPFLQSKHFIALLIIAVISVPRILIVISHG